MNDLDAMRDLGDFLKSDDLLPRSDEHRHVIPRRLIPPSARRGSWALLVGGITALLLLAGSGVAVLNTTHGSHPGGRASETSSLPGYNLAAQVLVAAAGQVAPKPAPRPDQYIFLETRNAAPGKVNGAESNSVTTTAQSWLSVDGRHDSLIGASLSSVGPRVMPGCVDGHQPALTPHGLDNAHPVSCTPVPKYDASAPTDAPTMFRYLYMAHLSGYRDGSTADERAFDNALTLMTRGYLPDAEQVALFEALARIPGLTVVREATDAAGRPAIGIIQSAAGFDEELFLDPKTYQPKGWQLSSPVGDAGKRLVISTAIMRVAIVDHISQIP